MGNTGNLILPILVAIIGTYIAHLLKRATDVNYVATLITQFQNDWHSKTAMQMRAFLQSDIFKHAFNEAIEKAYREKIDYKEGISKLLDNKKLDGDCSRLQVFQKHLRLRKRTEASDQYRFPDSGFQSI